ncbi:centrosomal protein of 126 kDa-like [Heterodontus francisci]|uniref:centrosomal protein of 126 kDa-like n=1 Tax=Heterodontus francisci TaxID=7792 RepID=UPI00355B3FB7
MQFCIVVRAMVPLGSAARAKSMAQLCRVRVDKGNVVHMMYMNFQKAFDKNIQISPLSSAFDPVQAINGVQDIEEAVSESTEQFMLAENLVETSAIDSDILAAMDAIESQRYIFLQNKVQRLGLSALSFEEQKLLQSLDHLDQRLQYIQETVQTSPSPFIISNGVSGSGSRTGQAFCDTQKHRSLAADNHARIKRKY